jgi:hypothetical protein
MKSKRWSTHLLIILTVLIAFFTLLAIAGVVPFSQDDYSELKIYYFLSSLVLHYLKPIVVVFLLVLLGVFTLMQFNSSIFPKGQTNWVFILFLCMTVPVIFCIILLLAPAVIFAR